jgi:hypothetical protein
VGFAISRRCVVQANLCPNPFRTPAGTAAVDQGGSIDIDDVWLRLLTSIIAAQTNRGSRGSNVSKSTVTFGN